MMSFFKMKNVKKIGEGKNNMKDQKMGMGQYFRIFFYR